MPTHRRRRSHRRRWRLLRFLRHQASRLGNAFLFPATLLLTAVTTLWQWLTDVWQHRDKRHLLQGIPSIVAFAVFIGTAIAIQLQQDNLPDEYRDAAVGAYRLTNWSAAKVYYERLSELDGGEPSTQFDLAMVLTARQEHDRAAAIMARLAPPDQAGYPRAHLWRATHLLSQSATFRSPALTRETLAHLTRAHQELPDSAEVNWRLGQFYVASGQREQAVPYWESAARQLPHLNFDLSLLYFATGDIKAARRAAMEADAYYREQVAANPDDDESRLRWSSIRMNLGDFEDSVRILKEGLARRPDGPYPRALAAAHIVQFDRLHQGKGGRSAVSLDWLRVALQYDPASREALSRLIDWGETSPDEQAAVQELLESLLTKGYANGFLHFLLGCKAWDKQNPESAMWHLERAYKLEPQFGDIGNNLAWVIMNQPDGDLERALQLANSVVQQWPENATYRDTRGQILAKLERWEDALDDLERALPAMSDNRQLHETLSLVYRRLNQPGLAEKHEELADALKP